MEKCNHYYLILLLSLLLGSSVFSQTTDWFVINNCSYLINGSAADTDNQGNLYVTGTYKGEVLFKSQKESGKVYQNYASTSRQEPFLIKYDSVGNIKLNIHTKNYSGKAIYTVSLNVLPSGKIAWVIRVDGQYAIVDKNNEEFPFRANGQSVLVLLSPSGEVLSQTAIPFDYCYKVFELDNDQFVLFGRAKRSRKNEVYLFNNSTLESKQVFNELSDLYAVSISDIRLFVLSMKVNRSRNEANGAEIRLYSNELDQLEKSPDLLFTKTQRGPGLGRLWLFSKGDQIDLFVSLALRKDAQVSIDTSNFKTDKGEMMLLRLDEQGDITGKVSMNTRLNGSYNTMMKQDDSGGYYLLTPVMEEFKIGGQGISKTVPKHGDFIHELVLFKFDENLNYKWDYMLGGTASNYHHSFIIPNENGLYYATDLLDFVTIDDIYHELDWRAGLLLGKIKKDE